VEVKELLEKGLADIKGKVDAVKDELKGELKTQILEEIKSLDAKFEEIKNASLSKVDAEKMQEHLDKLDVKLQTVGNAGRVETKSFNDVLEETIKENEKALREFANSKNKSITLNMKAAGDMSYASNFANNSNVPLTTQYQSGILPLADKPFYLRDILSQGTTNASTIWYPKHVGGEGSPAVWTSGTKAQFDFDFDAANVPVQWIAGFVRVPRQMLDDVSGLISFLRANMLKKLYQAETEEILNGNGTGAHLLGLMTQAQEYNGTYTNDVEELIDASYGQVADNGHNASHIVMPSRDAVKIGLNKASGSGEYDLPAGSVGFVNGKLNIGGLTVIGVQSSIMASGKYLVGDFSAAQLFTRLAPEIRIFEEDGTNARENMVTIRIEERVALATYYPNAFVKNKPTV